MAMEFQTKVISLGTSFSDVKGTVHPQKIFLKYVMLTTVTKNSTIIITKYTWYHRYREIIQITGGPTFRLQQKPDSKAGRSKLKCSDITSAISILMLIIVSFQRCWYLSHLNHFPLVRFLLAQTDMVVCHSWRNFNNTVALSSGIIICPHLFTCFCTGSTDFRSTGCVEVTSAFRSFRSLSSFKMAAFTGH